METTPKQKKHQMVVISTGVHTKAILHALNSMPEVVNVITTGTSPETFELIFNGAGEEIIINGNASVIDEHFKIKK